MPKTERRHPRGPAQPVEMDPSMWEVAGDDLAPALPRLVDLASEIGCTVQFEKLECLTDGYYRHDARRIAIHGGLSVNAQVATLVHELGHALLRAEPDAKDPELERAAEELVVESVAYTVCGALGLDTAGYSIPYLATWAQAAQIETIERTAGLIDRLARRIEDAALPQKDTEAGPREEKDAQTGP